MAQLRTEIPQLLQKFNFQERHKPYGRKRLRARYGFERHLEHYRNHRKLDKQLKGEKKDEEDFNAGFRFDDDIAACSGSFGFQPSASSTHQNGLSNGWRASSQPRG